MSLTSSAPRLVGRFPILYPVLAVILAIGVGVVAFVLLEGWSVVDALYLAAQTVTTVGYGDVTPTTRNGRIFATVFMLAGVGVVLYALTSTVHSIVHSELVATFGQRRLSRKMSKLRNHFIVCGAGGVGSHLARNLLRDGQAFIVLERDPEKVAELGELVGSSRVDLQACKLEYSIVSPK